MVGLKRISTVVGVLAVTASAAMAQGTANPNQAVADSVAGAISGSRSLASTRIEIEAQSGMVTLSGVAANDQLKAEAIARAQGVAGVLGVIDHLRVERSDRPPRPVRPSAGRHGPRPWRRRHDGRRRHQPLERQRGGMVNGGMVAARLRGASSMTAARCPKVRPAAPAAERGPCPATRTTPGRATPLPQLLGGRLPDRLPLAGLAEHRARSTPTRKCPSTGEPSRFVGTTGSGGWTSRSTTPVRSSRPTPSDSSPIESESDDDERATLPAGWVHPQPAFSLTSGMMGRLGSRLYLVPKATTRRFLRITQVAADEVDDQLVVMAAADPVS